ncbi:cytochrome c-type biogenesis protein CcsB [Nakamurella panacisegetis]|uniref:Cytochrome c-type biogenesis protein CcsB n=1 Tax=Nakamurella panacisegetis TaxID=1090615 RepID=A0A1H0NSI7_9ACTN|nr:c-type cytochrome biogenesis protein CcsB [Nakamurella panacisegetis]SDO95425.1 cytochrome c-type biogenesis protein CcsB [Nakamurella panacisegetis]
MAVNDQLGNVSYLGFQAALAGYIAALVCFGIEFASSRGMAPTPAEAVSMTLRAAGRGGTAVMDRESIGQIVKPPRAARRSMAALFGRAGLIVTTIGFVAHVFSIITRGIAAGRAPWGNMYEFTSLFCAAAITGFLVVLWKTKARSVGFFVMIPVVILMFIGGTKLYTQVESLVPALHSYWLVIHVLAVSLSSGVLMVSGVASVMYLLRSRYERKLLAEKAWAGSAEDAASGSAGGFVPEALVANKSRLAALPSLTTLDRVAYRSAIVAFPVFTFAVIAGAMWAEVAWGRYWGWDPKETCAFITWVFYAAYLHARATAGWRGSRAAWISVLGLVSVIFNLFFINMVVSGLHSYAGLN